LCDSQHYGGTCVSFGAGEYSDLDAYGIGDWVSSISFDESYELNTDVWMYREDGFSGEVVHTTASLSSLGSLDNHVRSLKVSRRPEASTFCSGYPDGVTLFSDANWNGDQSPSFTTDVSNLGNHGWSDRAVSVMLCGYDVTLYSDADYQGVAEEIGSSDNILSNNPIGEHTVTSLKVRSVSAAVPQLVSPFDGATYQEGASVTLVSDVSPGATWWEFNLYRYLWDNSHVENFYSGQISSNQVSWTLGTPGIYRWHLRSGNVHGYSAWSSMREFSIGVEPTATPSPTATDTPVPTNTPTPTPTPHGAISVSGSDTVVLTHDSTWRELDGMLITQHFDTGSLNLSFEGNVENLTVNSSIFYKLKVLGVPTIDEAYNSTDVNTTDTVFPMDMEGQVSVTEGTYTIKILYWANSVTAKALDRTLSVQWLP
jgi:hypothetical protein